MKYLHLLWANLKRKKLRTTLTLLSIFIAFVLFGLLCTIKEAFTGGIKLARADRLVVRHRVSLILQLPESYKARIERIPGVEVAAHATWFNGIYRDEPRNFFGSFPIDVKDYLRIYPEIVVSPEHMDAWMKTRNGAVVGRDLLKRFEWKIGDRVALVSPIWPRKGDGAWEFDIVGVYDTTSKAIDTSGFFFRYDYFDEARAKGEGQVGWYLVRVKDPERAEQIARAIDAEFANSPFETKAENEGAFFKAFIEQMGNIGAILIAILSAVFFTILLVAGNTMAQAVRERTEELGVLKAIGFGNGGVLGLVLAESCLLAALGGCVGLTAAWLLTLGGSPIPQVMPVFYLPGRYLILGAGFALLLGVVAGILPALQAMRLQIADALGRHA